MINEELWNRRIHQTEPLLQQPGVTIADIAAALKVTPYVARCVLVSGVTDRSGFQPSATDRSKLGCRQYPLDCFRPPQTQAAVKLLGRDPRA
jgi:hypothetical protein